MVSFGCVYKLIKVKHNCCALFCLHMKHGLSVTVVPLATNPYRCTCNKQRLLFHNRGPNSRKDSADQHVYKQRTEVPEGIHYGGVLS